MILTYHVRFVSIKPSSVSRNPPVPSLVPTDEKEETPVNAPRDTEAKSPRPDTARSGMTNVSAPTVCVGVDHPQSRADDSDLN
jgi:hypothetical protein